MTLPDGVCRRWPSSTRFGVRTIARKHPAFWLVGGPCSDRSSLAGARWRNRCSHPSCVESRRLGNWGWHGLQHEQDSFLGCGLRKSFRQSLRSELLDTLGRAYDVQEFTVIARGNMARLSRNVESPHDCNRGHLNFTLRKRPRRKPRCAWRIFGGIEPG
jgi:hypothetical protein